MESAVSLGGLGMVKAEDVAECAFVGRVVATRELVGRLLGEEECGMLRG